jgi:hypothetical protein
MAALNDVLDGCPHAALAPNFVIHDGFSLSNKVSA